MTEAGLAFECPSQEATLALFHQGRYGGTDTLVSSGLADVFAGERWLH